MSKRSSNNNSNNNGGKDGRASEMERGLSSSPSTARQISSSSNLRAPAAEQYGTSPVPLPNIPPRNSGAGGSENTTPARRPSPRPSSEHMHQQQQQPYGTSPSSRSGIAASSFAAENTSAFASANTSGVLNVEDLTDTQKARIVGNYLVDRQGQARSRRASRNQQGGAEGSNNNNDSSSSAVDIKGKLKNAIGLGSSERHEEAVEEDDLGSDEDGKGDAEGKNGKKLTADEFPTPFGLQGGDITHDLYKWQRNALANSPNNPKKLKRSKSTGELSATSGVQLRQDESDDVDDTDPLVTDVRKMREPGGFRRNYINRKISQAQQTRTSSSRGPPLARPRPQRATGSFIDFLSLYGHLAGEELEEIDEEDEEEEDEEAALEAAERGIPDGTIAKRHADERTPLLKRQDTAARIAKKRVSMEGKKGDATVLQAVLMLLKSFVGTGILFLGRAFYNGGMLFSTVVLLSIAMISLYSFLLLVKTRLVVPGSFGDMGGVLYGPWLRTAILTSITLSQIGFVAAYTIFVAENLQAFAMAVSDCKVYIPIAVMIFGQIIFYLPLAMFRNIHKLSGTALVADAFILVGIIYIVYLEVGHINHYGLGDVVLFNKEKFPLLIGTAVFSFEGVGLVIPITEAMREPEKFPKVLSGVMVAVAILFGGAGALGYATFGSDIQTVVLVNLPQDDRFVNVVQFLYSIAIMLSTPLQLFPAVRIMEQGIFSSSGKYSNRVKWQKNTFRSTTVFGCALLSWAGARDLDKFVSLIGSTACVPLCFCYPAMLHYKACAKNWRQRAIDITLVLFGLTMAIYTTSQTITMLAKGEGSSSPKFGKCPVPS